MSGADRVSASVSGVLALDGGFGVAGAAMPGMDALALGVLLGGLRELLQRLEASSAPGAPTAVWVSRGSLLAKTDVESAFRLLPVHPHSFYLLGCHWQGFYFVD